MFLYRQKTNATVGPLVVGWGLTAIGYQKQSRERLSGHTRLVCYVNDIVRSILLSQKKYVFI